ncbi:MAG TPA: VOC family protein [Polyangiales bacterium]|jgi:predicted enzyme related to lactoylglutathione lyase
MHRRVTHAFAFRKANATLSVEASGRAIPAQAVVQLYFECSALDETVAALQANGFVFSQEPTDMPYLWREARMLDPDGHDIRLFDPGVNRLDPPWKLANA